jgi:hypothetical protein
MRLRLALIALLLPLAVNAEAPPCPLTLAPADLQECSEVQAEKALDRLDGLMEELRRTLPRKAWAHVKEGQALWEKSMTHSCRAEATFEDITLQTSAMYQCEAWYSRERLHQLRYMLCPRYWQTGRCDAAKDYE